jgi:hypothetical protein
LLCLALASCNELNSVNYPVRMPTINIKNDCTILV